MARKHYFIELAKDDLDHLLKLQNSGELPVRKMKRFQTLLSLHQKVLPKDIARVVNLSFVTIYEL